MVYVIVFGETKLVAPTRAAALAMVRALVEAGTVVTIHPTPKVKK